MSTAYGASYAPLPTAAETASALARISSQNDDIQCAEQEIIGLEAQIAVLRDQIAARRNDIERLRDAMALDENTIASVRLLPSEIVAAIVVLVATLRPDFAHALVDKPGLGRHYTRHTACLVENCCLIPHIRWICFA
ncbi:hypothetical protein EXIGLDRAFT_737441, partial [Exidia glandulosa HHB12029]